ncbi:Pectate lyase L [Paramyrothecium foliicola]|nr:Pectate lyase L [Paramyrothecium foliicola]
MKSIILLTLGSLAWAADIYVAPKGTSGDGSLAKPLVSIQAAVDRAVPGDVIYLRGGTYSPTKNIQIKKSGTASKPYTLAAYKDEVVIIDGEALTGTPAPVGGSVAKADRGILHIEKANYWKFLRLTLINGPYGIYHQDSSNNYYERIVTHDNYETGFQIQGASANNQVLYLDSYRNRDPRKNGESADGFALKEGQGEGNVLIGARLWENVDDGLDLWEFKSAITIRDTIAWGNGVNRWNFPNFQGDGNGFKLGGGDVVDRKPANHVITNCIAFENAAKGFTDNSQEGKFTLNQNTAWNNGDVGFKLASSTSTVKGNIAAGNKKSATSSAQVTLEGKQSASGNSWQAAKSYPNSNFKSVDSKAIKGTRQANGKVAPSDFLLPKTGTLGATSRW